MTLPHSTDPRIDPRDVAEVMAANRARLIGIATGIALTIQREGIDLSRTPSTRKDKAHG